MLFCNHVEILVWEGIQTTRKLDTKHIELLEHELDIVIRVRFTQSQIASSKM